MADEAQTHTIPGAKFAVIEYPGPVKSTQRALDSLGGLIRTSSILASPPDPSRSIEFNLNKNNSFAHSVPGSVVETGNILLRVVKRRRKIPLVGNDGKVVQEGIFTLEPIGMVTQAVRFRAMADFQSSGPNREDPIIRISESLRSMDVEAILNFRFPQPNETFPYDNYVPPPVFSRHIIPQAWDYRPVAASVSAVSVRPSGEEVTRLVNESRWKGRSILSISHADPNVPTGPDPTWNSGNKKWATEPLEKVLLKLLDDRPVWTRTSICNQVTEEEARTINNAKIIIPAVSYTFSDGPFRDLVIRFGYDPRKHPKARFYQHVTLRNIANVRHKKIGSAVAEPKGKGTASRLSHVFDGQNVYSKVGNFQLTDITDPLCKSLVDSTAGVLPACSSDLEGWYDPDYFEQIRQVVRRKFMGILGGFDVTDEDCEDLMGDPKIRKVGVDRKGKGKAGSASESAGSTEEGSNDEGREEEVAGKKKKVPRKKVKKVPWEETSKKRGPAPKKAGRGETEEDQLERLKAKVKAIGDQKERASTASASAGSGSGSGSGSSGEEQEDDEEE